MAKSERPPRSSAPGAKVRRYFESQLRRFGDSPKSLGWSQLGQRRRFEVLAGIAKLDDADVLDVGCGLGHLYDFLRPRFPGISYTGLDISPDMVERARRRNPRALFLLFDGTSGDLPRRADFVFASGVLNIEEGDNERAMRRLIRSCFSACKSGTAVNMLSTWADWFDRNRHYYEPARILAFSRKITKRVVLRHDYMPHDFTVYLYRRP